MNQVVSTQNIVVSSESGNSNEREISYWRITKYSNKRVTAVFNTVLGKVSEYGELCQDFDLPTFLNKEYPGYQKFQGLHDHNLVRLP